jgi:hypothetical protein
MGRLDQSRKNMQKLQASNKGEDSASRTGKVVDNEKETHGGANSIN